MKLLAGALLALSFVATAHAQGDVASDQSTLSRAEVKADLAVYRESGLYWLQAADTESPWSPEYMTAVRRYQQLRAAPGFEALKEKYASRHSAGLTTTAH